jgi:hypothetical protein
MFKDIDATTRLSVSITEQNIDYWLSQPFISNKLRDQLKSANTLIIPNRGYSDVSIWYFPEGTEDVLRFLKARESNGLNIDICIEDSDFKELALHADVFTLPEFVVQSIVVPLLISLLVEYVKHRFQSRIDTGVVKSKVTITDASGKRSVTVDYSGRANEFEKVVGETIKLIDSVNNLEQLQDTIGLDYQERIQRLSSDGEEKNAKD